MGSDLVVVVVGDKIRTDLGVIGQWWRRMFMLACTRVRWYWWRRANDEVTWRCHMCSLFVLDAIWVASYV